MASGEMNFHGGNYSATVVIDANDALLKAQQLDSQIGKILKVLSTVARGKDVTPYWNKDRITKERILQAANVFRESETVEAAFELTKLANAYSAHHGFKSAAEELMLNDSVRQLIDKAKSMSQQLDSAFWPPALKEAAEVYEIITKGHYDVYDLLHKLRK